MPHLLVDITAHGYGHVAQTAPVVNALAQLVPDLRVTVRAAAPIEFLRQRFTCDFEHHPGALDFGMAMVDAVLVDVPRSLAAYRDYHADWPRTVAQAAAEMAALQPDLLFANVPYLSLAAAAQAGVPAVALCCLNWADIFQHYAPDDAASHAIHAQMQAAYASAQVFLKVEPTMPMSDLANAQSIAPIAQQGVSRREAFMARFGWDRDDRLVMVAMGGIAFELPMAQWPAITGVRWLVPAAWQVDRADCVAFESLGMSFSDALASCDAVLTKPGYGTFAEASCAGVPILYVSRGEWPEQPYLVEWATRHNVCREVDAVDLQRGTLHESLQQLWSAPVPPQPVATGAVQAATLLQGILTRTPAR